MKCLTEIEIAVWLTENGTTPKPNNNNEVPAFYLQFQCPTISVPIEAFFRAFIDQNSKGTDVLIHVTDWPIYTPSQMNAIKSIRAGFGESRNLIDAPGHLLSTNDHDLTTTIFSLTTSFQWDAYLYFPDDRATVFNWEGEIYDYWTCQHDSLEATRKLVNKFGLTEMGAG